MNDAECYRKVTDEYRLLTQEAVIFGKHLKTLQQYGKTIKPTSPPTGDLAALVPPISPAEKDGKSGPEALVGNIIDGKYRVLKQIGRGGAAVVYLGINEITNKQWAIKVVDKEILQVRNLREAFLHEPKMMMQFNHPAIPKVVDVVEDERYIYVVRDYIHGECLSTVIEKRGAIPADTVIKWAIQVCDALEYLHSHNPPYIYRDLKPGNIILQNNGNLKLIDFALAMAYNPLKQDVTILGTRGYAAPEQYAGQSHMRSDIFALGMTMHHMATGINPGDLHPHLPIRQINPNLPESLEAIIDKCVEPDPDKRFQTVRDLKKALQGDMLFLPQKSGRRKLFGK